MKFSVFLRTACPLIFFTAASCNAANAQPQPAPTSSPLPEIGRVVTGDRQSETLDTTSRTIYVVTQSDIIRRGFRSVAEALEDLPGINLARYGATGSLATLGIRGTLGTQVLVLIDGMPAAGAQTATVDLGSMPTSGVERIEVVEGGGSTLYGSGAIGGIINVITKPLSGKPIVELRDGSFGDRLLRLQIRNFAFERGVAGNSYPFPGGSRENADSQVTAGRFAAERKLGKATAEISGGIVDHNLGVPGPLPALFSTPGRQHSVDEDTRLALSWKRSHSETILELGLARQQIAFTCNDPADVNCFTPNGSLSADARSQVSFRNSVANEHSRLVYGIDLARGAARVDNGARQISVRPFSQSAIYAQQQFIFGSNMQANLGVRAERDGALGGEFSPSAGFDVRMSPALAVKGNYATAFRAPSVSDLYYPMFSNPKLQPERTRVADLTISDAAVLGGVALGWFSVSGNNLIAYPPPTYVPVNVQRASIAGLTLTARTKSYHQFFTTLNVTDLYRATDLAAKARLSGRGPVFTATLELGYLGTAHNVIESAGILTRTLGPRGPFAVATPAYLNPIAYTRLDAFVRIRLSDKMLLSLRGQNLGNERYSDVAGFPSPGRSFSLELSTR